MAHLEKLKPFILKWEGGFVDDPLDRGGATNKGITIGTFRTFYGKNATVEQLKNITDRQWDKIFEAGYWRPFKADQIRNQSIANICVDWAWASGAVTAIKQVQRRSSRWHRGRNHPWSYQPLPLTDDFIREDKGCSLGVHQRHSQKQSLADALRARVGKQDKRHKV